MIPRTILDQLAKLRTRERCLQLALGAAIVVAIILALAVAACAIDWAIDRFIETPRFVRWGLALGQVALWAVAAGIFLLLPFRRRLSDSHLALFVEDKVLSLGHRLISAVQLNSPNARTQGMSPILIGAVTRQAEDQVSRIDCPGLANHQRLGWGAAVGFGSLFGFGIILLVFGLLSPRGAVPALLARLFPWTNRPIPRYVELIPVKHSNPYPNDEEVRLEFKVKGQFRSGQEGTLRVFPLGKGRWDTYTLRMKQNLSDEEKKKLADDEAIYVATVSGRSTDFSYYAYLRDGRTREPGEVHYAERPAFLEERAVVQLPEYYGVKPGRKRYERYYLHGDIPEALVGSTAQVEVRLQKPAKRGEIELLSSVSAAPDDTPLDKILLNDVDTGMGIKLTDASLTALQKASIPQDVITKLEELKNRSFEATPHETVRTRSQLRDQVLGYLEFALTQNLTKEELDSHRKVILKNAEEYDFYYARGEFDIDGKAGAYRVRVYDENDFANEKPKPRAIHIIPDQAPTVGLLAEQIGTSTIKGMNDITGHPIKLGGDVTIAYKCSSQYGLGDARLKYRVYRGEENKGGGENKAPIKWETYDLSPVGTKGVFDRTTGAFQESSLTDQVQFYPIPSDDIQEWPNGLEGGGRFDFHTKALKLPDGKDLADGDFIEFYVEVSNREIPKNSRKWGQSSVRVKVIGDVWKWVVDALNQQEKLDRLKREQGGVFRTDTQEVKVPNEPPAPVKKPPQGIHQGDLKVLFKYNQDQPQGNQNQFEMRIVNKSNQPVPLKDLKLRYWFAVGEVEREYDSHHACARTEGYYKDFRPEIRWFKPKEKSGIDPQQCLELGFNDGAGPIPPGGHAQLQGNLHIKGYQGQIVFARDYSWEPRKKDDLVEAPKITLYQGDTIVWGTEPGGKGVFLAKEGEEDRKFGRSWRLIGPFPNPNADGKQKDVKRGRDTEYPPEVDPFNIAAGYNGINGKVRWVDQSFFGARIGLDNFFKYNEAGVAYAICWFHCKQKNVVLATGSDDGIKVWLNRKVVLDKATHRDAIARDDMTPIVVEDGWNELLVKVDNLDLDWAFYLDLVDPKTTASIEDIIVTTSPPDTNSATFVRSWLVIGPFASPGDINAALPVESDNKFDMKKDYAILNGNSRWKQVINPGGKIELDTILNAPPNIPAVGYAACWIRSDKNQPAVFSGTSDGGIKILLNGAAILSQPAQREGEASAFKKPCELKAGWNEVLVKVDRKSGKLGFSFEVLNPTTGKPIDDVDFRNVSPDSDTRYVRAWQVLGPFPNAGHNDGYDKEYPPELDKFKIEADKEYDGLNGKVKWKPIKSDLERVDLRKVMDTGGDKPGLGYAVSWVRSNNQQEALLAIGTDGPYKVWVNGKQEMSKNVQREAKPGEDQKRIRLNQGWNEIVLKVGSSQTGRWTYYFDVRNPHVGNEIRALDNIEFRATPPPEEPKKPEPGKKPEENKKPEPAKKPDPVKKPEESKKPDDTKKPEPAKKPEDTKKPEEVKESTGSKTFIRHWQVLGPLPITKGYQEFDMHLAPENEKFDINKEYPGPNGGLRWKVYKGDKDIITAKDVFGEASTKDPSLGFAVCWIHSDKAQKAVLMFGNNRGFKVLLNRKELVNNRSDREAKAGDDTRDVELVQGWNEIFVKAGTNDKAHPWAFTVKVLRPDRQGPLDGIDFRTTPP